jgi:hypothetical protein
MGLVSENHKGGDMLSNITYEFTKKGGRKEIPIWSLTILSLDGLIVYI